MGLFDSTSTSTTNSSGTTAPPQFQMPFINQGLGAASSALNNANSVSLPNNFIAQFTPEQRAAYDQMVSGGTNMALPNASATSGSWLTAAGNPATVAGLQGFTNYNPTNTVNNVLGAAGAYSQNPDVQGMIDAATRDARRAVSEQVLPQQERSAALGGNINSNRYQIARGITERGLSDQVGDISAQIRGGLYSQGLNLGQSQFANNDATRLAALGGATSGGINASNAGINANNASVAQQAGLYGIANNGIAGGVGASQADLSNQAAQYQAQTQTPFQNLQNYWNIAGKPLGASTTGTSTTTGSTTPSIASQIGGVAGSLGSLFGGPAGGALSSFLRPAA